MASESEAGVLSRQPPKRRREETVPDEIKKHESLYFTDGDIVLMSLPENHLITAFRVDKVFLSRHSLVFKDMFSFPSPFEVETYDGVPIVAVGDEADHITAFLNALYDPWAIPYKKHHCDTVNQVEGTLKLCTKYQVDNLRRRIIDHLLADWPNDLALWDAAENEMLAITSKMKFGNPKGHSIDHVLPEPCSVIRLARDCDIPELLPAAFYHLSRIPPFADLDVAHHTDDKAYWAYVNKGGRRARFGLLSRNDLMCVLKGSRGMAAYVHDFISTTLDLITGSCTSKSQKKCERGLRSYSKQFEIDALHKLDPLHTLNVSNIENDNRDTTCCCYQIFGEIMRAERSDLWNRLPQFFGLGADYN